jgi:hypothetical protein
MTIRWRPHLLWLLPACLAAVVVALFAILAAEDLNHREQTMEDEGRQVARFVTDTKSKELCRQAERLRSRLWGRPAT